MLSAVTADNPDYEGLRNYITGAVGPTGVAARNANARQPMSRPISSVPDAKKPIPTSSAKPWQQTNQRIVYTRVCTSFPDGMATDNVMEGDVVFCHRFDGMMSGYGTNRTSRVATIAQLNLVLRAYNMPDAARADASRHPDMGVLIMDPANNPMGESLTFTRKELEDRARDTAKRLEDIEEAVVGSTLETIADERARGLALQRAADDAFWKELFRYEVDPDKYRWQHCRFLSEWCVDGVLVSNEHEHSKDPMVGNAASHPGEALNICIGGPTPMRNSDYGEFPQHFDDGVRVLDKVFVGLVATENRDAANILTHYSYQYKLFTSRQLAWTQFIPPTAFPIRPLPPTAAEIAAAVAALPVGDARKVESSEEYNAFISTVNTDPHASTRVVYAHDDRYQPGANNRLGPSKEDFARMVDVWRVGSIMDSRAGMMPYKCAGVNVVVERWLTEQCAEEYNEFFGQSFALAVGINLDLAAVLARCPAAGDLIISQMQTVLQWLNRLGIDMQNVRADIREWQSMDRAWRDQDELVELMSTLENRAYYSVPRPRGVPKPTTQPPGPRVRPEGFAQVPHGTYYYRNPSADTVKFWTQTSELLDPAAGVAERNAWERAAAMFDPADANAVANARIMASVGRAAMFAADKRLYNSLDAAGKETVARAGYMHGFATAIRSAINCRRTMSGHVVATDLPWPAPVGAP